MRQLCKALRLPFDSLYSSKWKSYHTITGNNTTPSKTSRGKETSIESLPRQSVDGESIETLEGYDEYYKALELLGYPAD